MDINTNILVVIVFSVISLAIICLVAVVVILMYKSRGQNNTNYREVEDIES